MSFLDHVLPRVLRRPAPGTEGAVPALIPAASSNATANFIVLGHPRCGSNLVTAALREHPEIRMLGEIFSDEEQTRMSAWHNLAPFPAPQPYKLGEDGATVLDQRVFSAVPLHGRRAFGFKLFYHHARFDASAASAWKYLVSHKVKVIQINRRNLLDALLSFEMASRTSIWAQSVTDDTTPPVIAPFRLEPLRVWDFFEANVRSREWAQICFSNHQLLTIDYDDDLDANFEQSMSNIFRFLGLPDQAVKPGLKKQRTRTPREMILNFDELKDSLQQSRYHEYFEGTPCPHDPSPRLP